MSKNRTDKCKYESKYSPEQFITASQYIIELICEKKAEHDGEHLPLKFWTTEKWEKYYKSQVRAVSCLIKKYGEVPLLKTLRNNSSIYSFRPKWVEKLIIKEYNQLQLHEQTFQKADIGTIKTKDIVAGDTRIKRNSRSKLMGLDNE